MEGGATGLTSSSSTATRTTAAAATRAVDAALELIRDLRAQQQSSAAAPLPPFDERRVSAAVADLNAAHQSLRDVVSNPYVKAGDPYFSSSIHFHRARALRAKRCVVAYLLWRLRRLSEAWWSGADAQAAAACSAVERSYLQQYSKTMVEYAASFPIDLDLRGFTFRPPGVLASQVVEVRGLAQRSFVSPTTGRSVEIYPGKVTCLAFEDVELLLQDNSVALVGEDG